MHLGLSFELGNAAGKRLAIGADGLAEGFIGIEDGTELERQHRGLTEAGTDYAGVIQNGALVKISGALIFADDDRKIAAGIAVNRRSVHTFNVFNRERAAGSCLP